jgi:hypothetical protein
MKQGGIRMIMTLAALLFPLAAHPQQAPAQAVPGTRTAAARPVSPEIHPDRTVTFRLLAPKVNEVTLNGSWEGTRDIKMAKDYRDHRAAVGNHRRFMQIQFSDHTGS